MTSARTTLTVASFAALTLGPTLVASSAPAEALGRGGLHRGYGRGHGRVGVGVAAGALAAGAVASSYYYPYDGYGYGYGYDQSYLYSLPYGASINNAPYVYGYGY